MAEAVAYEHTNDVVDEARREPLATATDVCVATLDVGLRLLHANDDFLSRLGRPAWELHGLHFGELLHARTRYSVLDHLGRLAEEKTRRFTTHFQAAHAAARFSGGMTGLAVRGDEGTVTNIVVLVRPDDDGEHLRPAPSRRRSLSELDALVLEGVAAGGSTVQLAIKLYLSRQGVEYHVGSMLRRFGCPNRPALVAKAYAQGILTTGQWPPKVTAQHIR